MPVIAKCVPGFNIREFARFSRPSPRARSERCIVSGLTPANSLGFRYIPLCSHEAVATRLLRGGGAMGNHPRCFQLQQRRTRGERKPRITTVKPSGSILRRRLLPILGQNTSQFDQLYANLNVCGSYFDPYWYMLQQRPIYIEHTVV